mmetsp:Transcript_20224/g.39523  ORF Transcript_20224/g.39523 Transcript_20224/m.39523 type:complete len:100 (+) Transcript_20224:711-1010(+)
MPAVAETAGAASREGQALSSHDRCFAVFAVRVCFKKAAVAASPTIGCTARARVEVERQCLPIDRSMSRVAAKPAALCFSRGAKSASATKWTVLGERGTM